MLESRAERSALGGAPDIAVVDGGLNFFSLKTKLLNHTSKQTNDPSTISASDFAHEAYFGLHEDLFFAT